MSINEKTREVIKNLKIVRKEQNLSVQRITDMLEDRGTPVSLATVRRVFDEGSEDRNFRYEESIKPIADLLLDIQSKAAPSGADAAELEALRALVRYKNAFMAELEAAASNVEAKVQAAKDDAQLKVDFLKEQIGFKDKQIDQKDKQLDERADFLRQKDIEKSELENTITELKKELKGHKIANLVLFALVIIASFLALVLEPLLPLL